MKLTQKKHNKAIKSGMTLLELTVVILVLLSLIAILFVGARAWKKGSDRSGCIMNIRNVQQAVRGHMNLNNTNVCPDTTVIFTNGATDGYLPMISCPAGGTYSFWGSSSLPTGSLYTLCSLNGSQGHVPTNYGTW